MQGSNENHVAVATAVLESPVVITEETLEKALSQADAELLKQKQASERVHEQQLKELKHRLEDEVKGMQSVLNDSERREKAARQASAERERAAKDAIHKMAMLQVNTQEETERIRFEEAFRATKQAEEAIQKSWTKANPRIAQLLHNRDVQSFQHEETRLALHQQLKEEKEELENEWRRERQEWEQQSNDLNQKHSSNLMYGILLGGLAGFLFDKARY
jgi:F0F1-type ATP synthase assembly protein I